MSRTNPVLRDGHARRLRAAPPAANRDRRIATDRLSRDEFSRRWSLLMIGSFASREACAVHFGVTFQTSCNWFDGVCRPYGDQVANAWRTLDRFSEVMGA